MTMTAAHMTMSIGRNTLLSMVRIVANSSESLFDAQGTILPGVTRKSVIELARLRGYTVEEEPISVHEAMEADEVFTTGTAVVLCAVGSLTYQVH